MYVKGELCPCPPRDPGKRVTGWGCHGKSMSRVGRPELSDLHGLIDSFEDRCGLE